MHTSTNFFFVAVFGILFLLSGVFSAPIPRRPSATARSSSSSTDDASGSADNSSTSTTSASTSSSSGSGAGSGPWFAVYTDKGPDPAPAVADLNGINVVIMSFLLSTGAADMAMAWQEMSASQRTTIKQQYQAAGIKLLVSAFGSTEQPTSSGADPTQLASTMAAWVKQYGVDGIDVDYEDEPAMNKADGSAEKWLVTFTQALRSQLPQGQFILTHAPQSPWMGANPTWASGAYITVNKQVGSQIDWYNTQFYNQGPSEYIDCPGLLTKSSTGNPQSSVFEIAAGGFDLNKIVIGKPGTTTDASNGYMSTSTLADCVSQAKAKGWNAGVMAWEYPDANSAWFTAVRGSAFPVGGSSSSPSSPSSPPGDGSSASSTDGSSPTGSATDGSSPPASTDAGSPPAPTDAGSPPAPTDTDSPPAPTDAGSPPAPTDAGAPPAPTDAGSPPAPTDAGSPPAPTDAGSPPASTDAGSPPAPTDAGSPPAPTDAGSPPAPTDAGSPPAPTDAGSPPAPTDAGSPPAPTDGSSPSSASPTDVDPASPTATGAPGSPSDPNSSGQGALNTPDGASPGSPATTATFNNGMWTPSAYGNNGMWTPAATGGGAAATIVAAVEQRQDKPRSKSENYVAHVRRSRMTRRRGGSQQH